MVYLALTKETNEPWELKMRSLKVCGEIYNGISITRRASPSGEKLVRENSN